MAEAARVFGLAGSIAHKGQTYKVEPLDIDRLAMFEVWLESEAWAKVERTRGKVSAAVYQERHDAVTRLVCANAFSYFGPLAAEAMKSEAGRKYSAFLMLAGNPGMTPELADEIYEAEFVEFEARLKAADTPPNSPAPAD